MRGVVVRSQHCPPGVLARAIVALLACVYSVAQPPQRSADVDQDAAAAGRVARFFPAGRAAVVVYICEYASAVSAAAVRALTAGILGGIPRLASRAVDRPRPFVRAAASVALRSRQF